MNIIDFVKRHKFLMRGASLAAIVFGAGLMFSALKTSPAEEKVAVRAISRVELLEVDNFQKISSRLSVTGLVESLEQVELKSQVSAKIKQINVGLGDKVVNGQILASFSNNEIIAQLMKAEAGLDAEKVLLDELKRGVRIEEIKIRETQVANAKIALEDANVNMSDVRHKAEIDIKNIYDSAYVSLQDATHIGKNALLLVSDIQLAYFGGSDQESLRIQDIKSSAVLDFLGGINAGHWETEFISRLEGGAFGSVKDISDRTDFNNIDAVLLSMSVALNEVQVALKAIPVLIDFSDSEKSNLVIEKNNINNKIAVISNNQRAILSQKAVNRNLINIAQANMTRSESSLKDAQDQLNLAKAGATLEQIATQGARIKSAKADVLSVQAQLEKTIIRSPISGTIAVLPIRLGELVSPGRLVASVVNDKGLEIKAYINSDDYRKVDIGDKVIVKGDIGGAVIRLAPSIDPETKKVEVNAMINESDQSELVVGQFVNLDILINNDSSLAGIYVLPLQTIKIRSNSASVYTLNQDNEIVEHFVVLGEVIGESVEIIDGIEPEMKIVSLARGLSPGQKVFVMK